MNDKFFDLKQDKQNNIMNAAMTVFAKHGFKHSSTDEIIKRAGISKGLLFHYFISKIGLYDFIYNYSARYISNELNRLVDTKETTFFAVKEQIESAYLSVAKTYPCMRLFMAMADREEDIEIMEVIVEAREQWRQIYDSIESHIDYSAFGNDTPRIINMTNYIITGVLCDAYMKSDNLPPEHIYDEICAYLKIIGTVS